MPGTLNSTDDFTALEEDCDRIVFEYLSFDWIFERQKWFYSSLRKRRWDWIPEPLSFR
jgi:urate oxidase